MTIPYSVENGQAYYLLVIHYYLLVNSYYLLVNSYYLLVNYKALNDEATERTIL